MATNEGWQVYIVRCGDGSLYTGIAANLARRLAEHQSQGPKCAKYLRGRMPIELVFNIRADDRAQASRWENLMKQLSKMDKEALVAGLRPLNEFLNL